MRSRGIIVTLVVVLVVLFTLLNLGPLSVRLPLNLVFFTVRAPLGLILIGFTLVLSFGFLLISLFRRAGQLRQMSHLETELEHERALVQQKRLAELDALETRLGERFGTLETNLRATLFEHYTRLEAGEKAQAERLEAHVLSIRRELTTDLEQIESSIRRSLPAPRAENERP